HQNLAHRPKIHTCKFHGCSQSFKDDAWLARHELTHLGIKPFKCSWNKCSYAAAQRGAVTRHIRTRHFGLPDTVKEQKRRGIVDDRIPDDYIEVDQELLDRRLE